MRKLFLVLSLFLCWHLLAGGVISAQDLRGVSGGASLERDKLLKGYFELEKKLVEESQQPEEKGEVEYTGTDDEDSSIQGADFVFMLKKIVANPSAILSEQELAGIFAGYEGKEVSIKDLLHIVQKINELYDEKNYPTARAFLPVQKIVDGVVLIKLVEARYNKFIFEGNSTTRDSYIKWALDLDPGELVDLGKLKEDLISFNTANDISVKAALAKGDREGTTDCHLITSEPSLFDSQFYIDNSGRKETGRERLGVLLTDRSLLGFRDTLTLGGNVFEGGQAGHLGYQFPFLSSATRLGLYYDIDRTEIIAGPLEGLDLKGESTDTAVLLKYLLGVRPGLETNAYVEFHWKESDTEFENLQLFSTSVRTLVYGLNFTGYNPDGFWFLNSGFVSGFDQFGGDKSFFNFKLDYVRRQKLNESFVMLFRMSGQTSDTGLLPSSEQFQIGGMGTVRGYSEGSRVGDDGYFLSMELHYPLAFLEEPYRSYANGIVFADHGGAFPFKGNQESINHDDFLTSVGLGLVFNYKQKYSGRINLGVPLGDREEDQPDVRLHFYLQYNY